LIVKDVTHSTNFKYNNKDMDVE